VFKDIAVQLVHTHCPAPLHGVTTLWRYINQDVAVEAISWDSSVCIQERSLGGINRVVSH